MPLISSSMSLVDGLEPSGSVTEVICSSSDIGWSLIVQWPERPSSSLPASGVSVPGPSVTGAAVPSAVTVNAASHASW